MSNLDRITELESQLAAAKAENAKFEQRLAALEAPKHSPVRAAPLVEGTRVTILPPKCSFIMPTPGELLKLADIIRKNYPKFVFPDRSFAGAFKAIGMMHRTDSLDKTHYPNFWVSHAEELLRGIGDYSDPGPGFLAAVIAHGDVKFSNWESDGVILEFGLSAYGIGRAATDKWRRVLAGEVPRPVAPPSSRNYAVPQFRVTAG
jgi:hypothetical protein